MASLVESNSVLAAIRASLFLPDSLISDSYRCRQIIKHAIESICYRQHYERSGPRCALLPTRLKNSSGVNRNRARSLGQRGHRNGKRYRLSKVKWDLLISLIRRRFDTQMLKFTRWNRKLSLLAQPYHLRELAYQACRPIHYCQACRSDCRSVL